MAKSTVNRSVNLSYLASRLKSLDGNHNKVFRSVTSVYFSLLCTITQPNCFQVTVEPSVHRD